MSEDGSLYRQWWNLMPSLFAAMQPGMDAARAPQAGATQTGAQWFDLLQQSPGLTGTALTQLFDQWVAMLGQGNSLIDGLLKVAEAADAHAQRLRDAGAAVSEADAITPDHIVQWPSWAAPLLFAAGGAAANGQMHPAQLGADRVFGAYADALGGRPLREIQEALQTVLSAEAHRRAALAAYLGIVYKGWSEGTRTLIARLSEKQRSGEQLTSLLALLRLWVREADSALHRQMQSPQGLDATAHVMRASTRQRAEMQRLVEIVSRTLHMPTRAEVDDGFREIQELKREVRRLKKALRIDEAPREPQPARKPATKTRRAPAKRAARRAAKARP